MKKKYGLKKMDSEQSLNQGTYFICRILTVCIVHYGWLAPSGFPCAPARSGQNCTWFRACPCLDHPLTFQVIPVFPQPSHSQLSSPQIPWRWVLRCYFMHSVNGSERILVLLLKLKVIIKPEVSTWLCDLPSVLHTPNCRLSPGPVLF